MGGLSGVGMRSPCRHLSVLAAAWRGGGSPVSVDWGETSWTGDRGGQVSGSGSLFTSSLTLGIHISDFWFLHL